MPAREAHLAQAHHNTHFYNSFDTSSYRDWAATVLFYVGLHYIDAFLATKNIHPGSHDVRDRLVKQAEELRLIASGYFALKNSSRTARYYPPTNFSLQHIQDLEQVHLEQIRTELRRRLSI